MPNQVSCDKHGIFQIYDGVNTIVFARTEGVVENGSPDVAGWETSYLITAKLNPAGQGTAPANAAQTVNASTGVFNHS